MHFEPKIRSSRAPHFNAFKSRAEQAMRPADIELLMGHEKGVSESYWRPTENELLNDYLKAVPLLSVNDNSSILEKQIEQVNERNRQENIIINTRISEGMNYLEH